VPKIRARKMVVMMDILACFMDDFAKCTYFLMDCGEALGYRDHLLLDVFELYIILLHFHDFIHALDWRTWPLPDIIPLSGELFTILRNMSPLLITDPMRKMFHEFHIRLVARLMVNNREDALAADTLTLPGRQ
jgi:hypothetical protein